MTRREDRGAASEETLLPSLLLLLPLPLLLKKKEDVKAGKKEGNRYQRPSREEKEDGPAALVLHKEIRERPSASKARSIRSHGNVAPRLRIVLRRCKLPAVLVTNSVVNARVAPLSPFLEF